MEKFLASISALSAQKRLYPAEQIITSAINDFELLVQSNKSDSEIENIELTILKLLYVNNGNLSLQCCVRIANCLLVLYKSTSPPKVWNLISKVTSNPNSALIYTAGYVVDRIGSSIKSKIAALATKLLSLDGELTVPSLYALVPCFKRSRIDMKQYAKKAFNYGKKAVGNPEEIHQILGLRLIRTLLKYRIIPIKSILQVAHDNLDYLMSAFVIDECCYLIEKCAYFYKIDKDDSLKKNLTNDDLSENSKKEFDVSETDTEPPDHTEQFNQAFQIFSGFKKLFPQILKHFLDILPPLMIYSNLPIIFKQIRNINSVELSQLVMLFGTDVRNDLFHQVLQEKPPTISQLQILRILQSDENSQKEIAALALQLAQSESTTIRAAGSMWFSHLAEINPDHAKLYLETALLYLAFPPEDNPKIQTDTRAFGSIATHILGGTAKRDEMANLVANHITKFLEKTLVECNIFDAAFLSAFSLMTVLPEYLVPKALATAAISIFSEYPYSHPDLSDIGNQRLKFIAQSIALFLTAHSGNEAFGRFFKTVCDYPFLFTQTTVLALMIEAPKFFSNLTPKSKQYVARLQDMLLKMHKFFFKAAPANENLKARIKNPMIGAMEFLSSVTFLKPKHQIIFAKLSPEIYAYKVMENYDKYIEVIPKGVSFALNHLLQNSENLLMTHSLLLSICLNPITRKQLPSNFYKQILNTMNTTRKEYTRLQTSAECIGLFALENPNYLNDIIKLTGNLPERVRCFVYASLFSHANLEAEQLTALMYELDNFAQNSQITSFAFHALSVLFKTNSVQLTLMKISDIQCQVILNILNSSNAQHPYNLYYASYCFTNLLSVISPELNSNNDSHSQSNNQVISKTNSNSIVAMIQLIVQAFDQTRMPYSRQIFFHTIRSIFAFASCSIKIPTLLFPTSRGTSISLYVAACGAFTDMLKTIDSKEDFFWVIPRTLLVLQRSCDHKVSQFVSIIAQKFADKSDPNNETVRNRITEWVKIFTSCLANSVLPDSGIEAGPIVKQCCLKTAAPILQLLAKSEPLMTENLDDMITSITRAIETNSKLLLMDAYNLFTLVVQKFEKSLAPEGSRLLLLYDSQFSIAVRNGFICNLTYSGAFLNEYLHFHLEDLKTSPEEFENVLTSYVKGLKTCDQRTFAYFAVAAHIICLARENKSIFEMIKEFANSIITHLCEIVNISMAIWRTTPPDWQQISQFRANYMSFYREISVAFVWLQAVFENEYIEFNKIIDFEIEELATCTESWRVLAAFDTLNTAFLISPQKLTQVKIDKALECCDKANEKFPLLLSDRMPKFVQICKMISAAPEGGITSEQLSALSESSRFDTKSTAEMIQDSDISQISDQLSDRIFSEFISNQLSVIEFLAFSTLMFEKLPDKLSYFLGQFFERFTNVDDQTKLNYLTRILKRSKIEVFNEFHDQICKFAWSRFKIGGLFLISQLLIDNPNIGIEIFLYKDLKIIAKLIDSDILNALVYLQFMTMGISIISDFKDFDQKKLHNVLENAAIISFNAISKWGADLRGEEIICHAAYFLRTIEKLDQMAVRQAFDSNGVRMERLIVQFTENEMRKTEAKLSVKTLKTFSSNTRRVQNDSDDDEWQTLECED
ncbi:hypothetical protein TRFO_14340 [Tritrichomonas foetus]|uniref:Uncharacterized protein n=1 Tax=Tritrichomonas foetus TaxID=1144522 RepID=A0A1J4KVA7_9EUKA|nr:hypothetical protein TRFO_14340 [Tritrichomonas foetus]|eukprot:OHT15167.1 hypothetical protein TRFO_14340 [Tritrichomonas foetus]